MWLHNWLNPHCLECKDEREESRICSSCETLRHQLEIANHNNELLMNRLLEKPEKESDKPPVEITRPRTLSWNIRKQMLEQEDREKARLMREASTPSSTEELEKELGVENGTRYFSKLDTKGQK